MKAKVEKNKQIRKILYYESILLKKKHFIHFLAYKPSYYFTKLRNFCVVSKRPRAVFKFFRLSRIAFAKSYNAGFSKLLVSKFNKLIYIYIVFCPYGGIGRHGSFKSYCY